MMGGGGGDIPGEEAYIVHVLQETLTLQPMRIRVERCLASMHLSSSQLTVWYRT